MNEQLIKKFLTTVQPDDDCSGEPLPPELLAFAELIVQECVSVGQKAELDGAYCWGSIIKQHFGVE
jgi:hypothetical protein